MASCFYDTSSLLTVSTESLLSSHFYISSITLKELEEIKTNQNKSQELKYKAREIVRLIDSNRDAFTVVFCNDSIYKKCGEKYFMPTNNDNLILTCATETSCDAVYSEDLCMRLVGRDIFGLNMSSCRVVDYSSISQGYKQVQMSASEYYLFLNSMDDNKFNCCHNEYLIVYDDEFDLRDVFKWDGNLFVSTYNKQLKSITLGDKIKPKDEFQRCAIDSLVTNSITAITGMAGSGKTLLALSAAMYLIDSHKYESLTILFNPTSTRGAARMGFYSGSAIEKAKQTSIGHILNSKFGDPAIVDNLLATNRIKLISMADARGLEIRDDSILFITECQNTSTDLLKLCLTRVSSGSKVFIEGDYESQLDDSCFDGENNGLMQAIKTFSGDPLFCHVDLPNIYRSKIAELAQKL